MGAYDNIRCHYPLPLEGAGSLEFQTRDTSAQFFEDYEIRADGTLWHCECDYEDQSDPNATGLKRWFGSAVPVNPRWVQEMMTGEIRFHAWRQGQDGDERIEFSAYFVRGALRELHRIEYQPIDRATPANETPRGETE